MEVLLSGFPALAVTTDQHGTAVTEYTGKNSPFPHLPIIHLFAPKILHKHCFKFLLGRLYVPGEIENNAYANIIKRFFFLNKAKKYNIIIHRFDA